MPAGIVGSGAWAITKELAGAIGGGLWGAAKLGGKGFLGLSKGIGHGVIGGTKATARGARSLTEYVGEKALNKSNYVSLAYETKKIAQNTGELMTRRTPATVKLNQITGRKEFTPSELQISSIGKATIAGAFLMQGTGNLQNEIIANKMGQVDENKVTATPVFGKSNPIGPLSGGADGSLVFALHNNR